MSEGIRKQDISDEKPEPNELCGCGEPATLVAWMPVDHGTYVDAQREPLCEACGRAASTQPCARSTRCVMRDVVRAWAKAQQDVVDAARTVDKGSATALPAECHDPEPRWSDRPDVHGAQAPNAIVGWHPCGACPVCVLRAALRKLDEVPRGT